MASVSAAVTVFGRQAGDVCLCDTEKIYLAADTAMQHVLQGTAAQMSVTASQNRPVNFKLRQIVHSASLSRYF